MKGVFAFFCILTALPPAAAETPVLLRLETSISTKTAKIGDAVHMRTASAVSVGGQSIPIGSYTRGAITRSQRAGRVHGRAELEIRLDSIVLADGTTLPVTGSSTIGPPRREHHAPDPAAPVVPILVGMGAGFGAAMIAANNSHSEETIAGTGLAVGAATAVLVGVLKRGEDLELRPGREIEGLLETH
jgi:hypothetical protein